VLPDATTDNVDSLGSGLGIADRVDAGGAPPAPIVGVAHPARANVRMEAMITDARSRILPP